MTREKQSAIRAIEKKSGLVAEIADRIWEYAELSLQEEKSAELYCRVLEQEGFRLLGLRGDYADAAPGPQEQRIVYIARRI